METPQRRILLVDDDPRLLALFESLMSDYAGGRWHIQTATEPSTALSLLQAGNIDLLIVDVHMPLVDGVQFLRLIQRRFPGLAKVVLTGDSTGAHRQSCLDSGADLFLEKPRAAAGWQAIFATLDQLTRFHTVESGFRGMLRRVELQDVLQMECLTRSSSVLEVTAGKVTGRIYIQEGSFIHAEIADKAGEEAFNTLLALRGGEFGIHPFTEPARRSIDGPWEFLLMEAARRRDENAALAAATPTPEPMDSDAASLGEPQPREAALDLQSLSKVAAEIAPAPGPLLMPQIDEVVLCSTRGDVLYESRSTRTQARFELMSQLRHKAEQIGEGLALGPVDQLEVEGVANRFVLHLKADCCLFVRASLVPRPAALAPSP